MEKRKLAIINSVDYGSTGRIAVNIAKSAIGQGHDVKVFVFTKKSNFDFVEKINCGCLYDLINHAFSRIDGKDGFYYKKSTQELIQRLDEFKPDIIHLHNAHGYYLNLPLLLNYINKKNIKLVWTLHDFWTLTGRCGVPHDCKNYLSGCKKCLYKNNYPYAIVHKEYKLFKVKEKLLNNLHNVTLISPSQFLTDRANETYLKKYKILTINNGIDLDIFKFNPINLHQKLGLDENKKLLLDVANPFSEHKGIKYLNELSERLSDDYQIILIGNLDGNSINKNIISIPSASAEELASYYSSCDLLVNPTVSDNYPTVDMECIACGLPVITFNVGGTKEIVTEGCGVVLDNFSTEELVDAIVGWDYSKTNRNDLINRANNFSFVKMIDKYLDVLFGD